MVGDDQGRHGQARGAGVCDHVGEVDLTLVVVRAQRGQGPAQMSGVEDVDAGIDLRDGALLGAGIALLDDGRHGAVGLAHDPAVAGGVVQDGRQQGHGVAALDVLGEQSPKGGGVQQRHVPAGHHDRPCEVLRQRGEAAGDGTTGARRLVLVRGHRIGCHLGQVGDDGVALVAHDDDEMIGAQAAGGGDGVVEETAPADGVQHLWNGRAHAGALACGHDDGGGGCGGSHESSSRW